MDTITVTLDFARETKGSVLYKNTGATAHVNDVYIRKAAFPNNKAPKTIIVTIESGDPK